VVVSCPGWIFRRQGLLKDVTREGEKAPLVRIGRSFACNLCCGTGTAFVLYTLDFGLQQVGQQLWTGNQPNDPKGTARKRDVTAVVTRSHTKSRKGTASSGVCASDPQHSTGDWGGSKCILYLGWMRAVESES